MHLKSTTKSVCRRHNNGYTIIELIIVLAIIGILFSISFPTYKMYTLRSSRVDAKAKLLDIAATQERHYSIENSYLAKSNIMSENGKYIIAVTACASGTLASCFVATAIPLGDQAHDECGTLTISNIGERAASGGTVQQCWVK